MACSVSITDATQPIPINSEIIDRLLIARLEIDPQSMSYVDTHLILNRFSSIIRDDLEYLPVVASLPAQQTVFEYLVGCWKRVNIARSTLQKKVCSSLKLRFRFGDESCF